MKVLKVFLIINLEKVRVFYHGSDERFECFTGIYEQTNETENDKPVWRHTSGKDIVLYSAPVSNWHFNTKIEKDFAAVWVRILYEYFV